MATALPVVPSTISVGKGTLLFKPDGDAGAWMFDECPGFNIAIESERLIIKSYRTGIGQTVLDKLTAINRTATITCISGSDNVVKSFLVATSSTITQTSATVTDESVGPVAAGRAYRLGTPTIIGGARKISAVTVAVAGTNFAISTAYTEGTVILNPTPTARVYVVTTAGTSAGALPTFPTTTGGTVTSGTVVLTDVGTTAAWANVTDYSYDPEFGIFNVHAAGAIATMIGLLPSTAALTLKLGYARAAANTLETKTGATSSVTGELWFFEEDPINDKRYEWVFPNVSLTPSGDYSLITEEAREITFEASINKPSEREAIYKNGLPVAA
jgi:hypothetical protein